VHLPRAAAGADYSGRELGFHDFAIWLAFLYPAAQVLRLLDQVAAAIHPGFSVVESLHGLLSLTVSAVGG